MLTTMSTVQLTKGHYLYFSIMWLGSDVCGGANCILRRVGERPQAGGMCVTPLAWPHYRAKYCSQCIKAIGSLSSLFTKKQDNIMKKETENQNDTGSHLMDKLPIGGVMQAEVSDGVSGAAVGQRSVGQNVSEGFYCAEEKGCKQQCGFCEYNNPL